MLIAQNSSRRRPWAGPNFFAARDFCKALGGFSGFGGGPFYGTGYYGGGGLGLIVVILLILVLLGRI